MRRLLLSAIVLSGSGLALLGLGFALMTAAGVVHAQGGDEDEKEYVGTRDCADCHRDLSRPLSEGPHALALQEVEDDKAAILADFRAGEDLRTVQFPGESEPRAFTADDIVYAIGKGRYMQRYLVEMDGGQYAVLPAQWNVGAQAWEPYGSVAQWPDDPAYDWALSCAGCHTTGLDVETGEWEDDGVQCEACHGPGSLHVDTADEAGGRVEAEELTAIRAAIVLTPDAQVCGRCHSQGTAPDGHAYPVNYLPGGTLLDETVFALVPPDDSAHWWPTGHASQSNMQFNEWLRSAHATALDTLKASPDAQDGCLQCHSVDHVFTERLRALTEEGDREGDPPEPATLDSAQFGVTCATCHNPHSEEELDFFLVDEPYTLCTSCHRNTDLTATVHHPVLELFEGQSVVDGIEGVPSAHFSAEDGPRCVTCHMPDVPVGTFALASHTFRPVLPGPAEGALPDSCSGCHDDMTAADLQYLIDDTQAAVRDRLTVAWARLASVAQPEAGTPAAEQYDRVVAALSFVQNEGSLGVHNYAYTDALLNAAARTLSELSVPGAVLQPTEGPAPTATPAQPLTTFETPETSVPSGVRPITVLVIALVFMILLVAAYLFFRKSNIQEA